MTDEISDAEIDAALDRAVFKGIDRKSANAARLTFEVNGRAWEMEFQADRDLADGEPVLDLYLYERT